MPSKNEPRKLRVGVIVNPIAGMGGSVGLQGTDGVRASQAVELGAAPLAGNRAGTTLRTLTKCPGDFEFKTAAGAMGEAVFAAAGIPATLVYQTSGTATDAADTRGAVQALDAAGVDLILFAGGDGTAADILEASDGRIPLLGIPAGVKMHSAVFATSPRAAGDALLACRAALTGPDRDTALRDAAVMDRPDDGTEAPSPVLLGYVPVPDVPRLIAPAKAANSLGSVDGACRRALEYVADGCLSLLGPGKTMQRIKQASGCYGSLLGVDAVQNGQSVGKDLSEAQVLELIAERPARIVVGVVGGQGFLFGRGNQQLSAEVIRRVGRDNIVIVAALEKLTALPDRCLLVDTGDERLDAALSGYIPVLVGYRKTVQMPVVAPRLAR